VFLPAKYKRTSNSQNIITYEMEALSQISHLLLMLPFDKINSMGFTKLLPWTKDKVKKPNKKSSSELPKINQSNYFGSPHKTQPKKILVGVAYQK
jgi:hypothetical protein